MNNSVCGTIVSAKDPRANTYLSVTGTDFQDLLDDDAIDFFSSCFSEAEQSYQPEEVVSAQRLLYPLSESQYRVDPPTSLPPVQETSACDPPNGEPTLLNDDTESKKQRNRTYQKKHRQKKQASSGSYCSETVQTQPRDLLC